MRSRPDAVLTMLVVSGALSAGAPQAASLTVKEDRPGLLKHAKISATVARQTAQAKFPNGAIVRAEIEWEKGRLIYSFEIQQPGVVGIEEVNVNAMTGAVVGTEHEVPAPPRAVPAPAGKPPTS